MLSLTENLGHEGGSHADILETFEMLAGIFSQDSDDVHPFENDKGAFDLGDLNLAEMNMHQKSCGSAVDVVIEYTGTRDMATLLPAMREGRYNDLPEPLRPKTDASLGGFNMSMAIVEKEQGSWIVVKVFDLQRRQSPKLIQDHLAQGVLLVIDLGTTMNKKIGKDVFRRMFEKLGGIQFRYWKWPEPKTAKTNKDTSKISLGYEFLRSKRAPVSNCMGEFIEFADLQSNNPQSPVFGWAEGKIICFLKTMQQGRMTAKTIDFWPYTYKDLEPWFIHFALLNVIGDHEVHGMIVGGITQCGKSMFAKTHFMQVSQYHIEAEGMLDQLVASIITAKNIDFFRGEKNTKFKPAIFDDGHLPRMKIEDVKSFAYPSEEDSLLMARWNGSSFDRHMGRGICTQTFDATVDKDHKRGFDPPHLPHEQFFNMVRPAFDEKATDEDVEAVMRRGHFLWFTQVAVYLRVASAKKTQVNRVFWPDPEHKDIFRMSIRTHFKEYQKGSREYPPDHQDDIRWSQALLKRCKKGEDIPPMVLPPGSCASRAPRRLASFPAMSQCSRFEPKASQPAYFRNASRKRGAKEIDLDEHEDTEPIDLD